MSKYISLFILCSFHFATCTIDDYGAHYISKWKEFYPSKAVAQGMHPSIYKTEDFSGPKIDAWIAFNESTIQGLSNMKDFPIYFDTVDARLLKTQARSEIAKWKEDEVHKHSLTLYTSVIQSFLENVPTKTFLTRSEKVHVICDKIESLTQLALSGINNLKNVHQSDLERGVSQLTKLSATIESGPLIEFVQNTGSDICPDLEERIQNFKNRIDELLNHVENELRPNSIEKEQILGKEAYAKALALYVDSELSPDRLAEMALSEIETVRSLIEERALDYFRQAYPDRAPVDNSELVQLVFSDMEKDAPLNSMDYLEFWKDLSDSAVAFLKDADLVTLPAHESLKIETAPESAGPAARIGWVDVAPHFAPNPMTTLYLPSIPDTLDQQEQIDFWSSFNKPFNRMIVIHELYPGHYMQYNIARETAHPIRLLFPYGPYSEGWATFCEVIALDAGWESERPLTYLAHLRKRLENANRAYTSVMTHCNDWDQEKVMQFSIDRSLLAPQFAKKSLGEIDAFSNADDFIFLRRTRIQGLVGI